eukprot:COSAG01_NODE_342_length_18601_cov_43.546319_11_plen_97_part_00
MLRTAGGKVLGISATAPVTIAGEAGYDTYLSRCHSLFQPHRLQLLRPRLRCCSPPSHQRRWRLWLWLWLGVAVHPLPRGARRAALLCVVPMEPITS